MKSFKNIFSPDKVTSFILYFSIFAFIIALNFTDNRSGGWYQQFLPNIGNRQISDIFFLDSLTGWSVTPYTGMNDTAYVLKTTNGGDNWNIANVRAGRFVGYNKVLFLNSVTGFVCGVYQSGVYTGVNKSTNGGLNWININTPEIYPKDMSVLNENNLWIVDSDGLVGGVYKTTNGGTTWTRQLNLGTLNPENIYMYNKDIGFISKVNTGAPYTRKTTDGGQSWFVVVNNEGFTDIYFTDSLTGWRAAGPGRFVKKTSDGGINWTMQSPPSGGNIYVTPIFKFSNVNKDTIWGAGGVIQFGVNNYRGIIYITTNGGNNWGYQLPDTSIHIEQYNQIEFTNKLNGWVLGYGLPTGVHTKIGGDTTFYTGVQQLVSVIPEDFELKQNYPNPFNPRTVIRFSLRKNAKVRLIVYDIRGIEVQRLADGRYDAGEYEADFMGKFSSSGVYFYRIEAEDERSGKVFSDTKRMILLK